MLCEVCCYLFCVVVVFCMVSFICGDGFRLVIRVCYWWSVSYVLVVVLCLLFVFGANCLLIVVCRSLCVGCCLLFVVCWWCVAGCLLVVGCCLLRVVLFVTCCQVSLVLDVGLMFASI